MTTTTTQPSRRERAALADLFDEVGPDAPTLCGDWSTRDLAAHLIMRERRPDAAAGLMISPLAGYSENVRTGIAGADWDELVGKVRSGPQAWSPTRLDSIDRLLNTIEFFVHHEDVRRAGDEFEPRQLDQDLRDDLRTALGRMARPLARGLRVGLVLEPDDTTDTAPLVVKRATPSATVSGPIGEIVLFMYGRAEQAEVEIGGDDEAVEALRDADFGI